MTTDEVCPKCTRIALRLASQANAAEKEVERLKAENASLREELEEARNEACVRCGFPTHDITSAAVAGNASLLESLRDAQKDYVDMRRFQSLYIDADHARIAAEQRAEAAEKERDAAREAVKRHGIAARRLGNERAAAEKRAADLTGALRYLIAETEHRGNMSSGQVRAMRDARAALHDEERSAPPQTEETAIAALREELERNIAELNEANEACCSAEVERDDAIAETTRLQEAVGREHTDACATYVETLRAGLEREIARRDERIASLFAAIEHGDDKHRAWLRGAIAQHFGAAAQGEEK